MKIKSLIKKFTRLDLLNILKRSTYTIIISILFVAIFSFHFEYNWFQQFDLQNFYLKKTLLQILSFLASFCIGFFLNKWQLKWVKATNRNDQKRTISGYSFTFILLSVLFLIITLLSYLFVFTTSTYNLVEDILQVSSHVPTFSKFVNLTLFYLTIGVYLVLDNKKAYRNINLLSITIFCFTFIRSWDIWALAFFMPNAGSVEPVFNSDVSFGIGRFPAIKLFLILTTIQLSITILTSFWYLITYRTSFSDWSFRRMSSSHKSLIKPLSFILLLNFTSLIWISRHSFLFIQRDLFSGANWLDVHFNIPLRTISGIFIILGSIFVLLSSKSIILKKIRYFTLTSSALLLLVEPMITPVLDWILVKPREFGLESDFIKRSISSTRKAFQLDSIKTKLINPSPELSKKDLLAGADTLRNVRLWDSQPLLASNRQLQQLKVFYSFPNASVDRYRLNSNIEERQQVIITARELNQRDIPSSSKTWINKHFVFTHGYGFTLSPVNTKGDDGLPEYFIRDLGKSTKIQGSEYLGISKEDVKSNIPTDRASIYFGTLDYPYAIVPSNLKELDYPEGDKNIFNNYDGIGGIPIHNLINRISAAIYLKEPRILNTNNINIKTRLLSRRQIKKRIRSISPFIKLYGEPYLVSTRINELNIGYDNGQHLYWIVEGYTISNSYPYSSRLKGIDSFSYIRNSVKIIVDAYNGSVKYYINEPKDPMILGWKALFPEIFQPISKMPISLRTHIKVPTHLFEIQVKQLLKYHVEDPKTFYGGDDLWQVPNEVYGDKQIPVEPYHITAQLSDSQKPEFLLLQPLSPLARPNLSAWLAARSDGINYGELVLLRFPSETTIYGPEQIQALINQDPSISQQFSLWDRAGSEVIQGNLLVLPLGKSLLYVEPVYLKASTGGLPTLARIVVSDGKRISMKETLNEAVKSLLDKSN